MRTMLCVEEEVDLSDAQGRPPIDHLSLLVFRLGSETDRAIAANIGQCSSELLGCPVPESSGSGASGLLPAMTSAKSKNNMARRIVET